jgi:hypothetical protein
MWQNRTEDHYGREWWENGGYFVRARAPHVDQAFFFFWSKHVDQALNRPAAHRAPNRVVLHAGAHGRGSLRVQGTDCVHVWFGRSATRTHSTGTCDCCWSLIGRQGQGRDDRGVLASRTSNVMKQAKQACMMHAEGDNWRGWCCGCGPKGKGSSKQAAFMTIEKWESIDHYWALWSPRDLLLHVSGPDNVGSGQRQACQETDKSCLVLVEFFYIFSDLIFKK